MSSPTADQLVRCWPLTQEPARSRVLALAVALDGPAALARPLGRHHQWLLTVHRDCVRTPLEALVTCRSCGADSEFPVPVAEVLALPAPSPDHTVRVMGAEYRLPTVEDLAATVGARYADAARTLARRTCRSEPVPELDADGVRALAAAWEEADPAAAITVDLTCVSCGTALRAAVDPIAFVARDLDRLVERLLGEVHALASAYGWTERAVLDLPEGRRRRYLSLVAS